MKIELQYPNKALWPNGRAHWGAKNKETQKHKAWAYAAAYSALRGLKYVPDGNRIPIRLTVGGKKTGSLPDKDNCLAAAKAYLDGIAMALGVNDSLFDPQPVHFSGRNSTFTIEVGA